MAPSSSNSGDDMSAQPPQRVRSKSDADIDYTPQDCSSEQVSSGTQTELSVEDTPPDELPAVAHDGTHDALTQDTESEDDTSSEKSSDTVRPAPSEQVWFRGTLVTPENAQALFQPSACIFVANLDRTRSGNDLTEAVHNLFAQIGPCWVKVRFDKKNIPAAFVQYQTDEEAIEADAQLHGARIFGRPCRIKHARAPRTVFVARRDQADVCVPLARYCLEQFGKIEHFWTPSHTERAMYNLPPGVFLRFEFFQHCQIALRALRNHETFTFTLAQVEKRQPALTSYSTILPEVVRNAIYVGDLPYGIDKRTLLLIFSHYGRISNVEVHQASRKGITYAFIYFDNEDSATMACQFPLTYVCGEHLARVEPKRIKHRQRPYAGYQAYNWFSNLPLPFFRDGRQYTYFHGDSRYTPRSWGNDWSPY